MTEVPADVTPPARIESWASECFGEPVACRLEHSWFRRRYAPANAPRLHFPNSWHQDGGLGVAFFSELNDAALHAKFPPEDFWVPELEPGDALLFHPGVLHRTHVTPSMQRDRLSIEYRFFSAVGSRPE